MARKAAEDLPPRIAPPTEGRWSPYGWGLGAGLFLALTVGFIPQFPTGESVILRVMHGGIVIAWLMAAAVHAVLLGEAVKNRRGERVDTSGVLIPLLPWGWKHYPSSDITSVEIRYGPVQQIEDSPPHQETHVNLRLTGGTEVALDAPLDRAAFIAETLNRPLREHPESVGQLVVDE